MKGSVAIVSVLAVVASMTAVYVTVQAGKQKPSLRTAQLYQKWAKKFMISRKGTELALRMRIFEDNLKLIEKSNANPELTFKLGLNQFGDMSDEEFRAYLGVSVVPASHGLKEFEAASKSTPDTVDWQAKGAVASVKN